MARRMIETDLQEEDRKIEGTLRPQKLKDYIGQSKIKDSLQIYIQAARQRNDALDHVLCCFMDLRVLERQHLPELLRTKWVSI